MNASLRRLRSVAVAVVLASGAIVAGAAASNAAAGSGTPYHDPDAVGVIGLCDKAGHQITHGSINTRPFVWRAVSTQAAQAPYNEPGRTAVLLAYQPRQETPSGDWSGDELTAATRYANPAHPTAVSTSGDNSLGDFIEEFHPMWDGLLQLRIFLGAPDHPIYSLTYPALDIKVTGNTWHTVDGGTVSCQSGAATSVESIVLPKATPKSQAAGHPNGRSTSAATKSTATSAPTSSAAPSAGSGPAVSPTLRAAADSSSGSSGHSSTVVGVIIAALVVLVVAGYVVVRRRTRTLSGSPSSSSHRSSKKGR